MKTKKLTKIDLINELYNKTDSKIEKQQIQEVIDSFLVEIKDSLIEGATIELRGFGTFEPKLRKGKTNRRNVKTGESVKVESHYIASFRAGQELKDKIWNLQLDEEE